MTRLELLTEIYFNEMFSEPYQGKHERINRIKQLMSQKFNINPQKNSQ